MYSRAPRELTQAKRETADHVGPGIYEIPDKKQGAEGYAPFLCMKTRDSIFQVADQVVVAPGPGHYNPVLPSTVVGCKALAAKSQRFSQPRQRAPGPGTYSLSKSTDWLRQTYPPVKSASKSRLRYERQRAAPSIPTPGQSYGYEDMDGTLVAQDAPTRDKTMGPAYYKVSHDETETTKKYKGVHFGSLTSQRMKFAGKIGPGPGDYNYYQEKAEDSEIHASSASGRSKKFESKLPRYHELVEKQEKKKAVPGPGKYNITGKFDEHLDPDIDQPEKAPFGSYSKRFISVKDNTPAPGAYNDPRTSLEVTKRISGLKRSPFGQTSARFKREHRIRNTPGPCAYNNDEVSSLSGALSRKAVSSSTRKGGFGTTSFRTAPLTRRNESNIPGPAHYMLDKPSSKPKPLSSTFASMTSRLPSPPAVQQDIPSPGSYEVSKSHDISQGKGFSSRVQQSAPRPSFGLTTERFALPRDILVPGRTDDDNPGPGQYETQQLQATAKNGLMVTQDKRFKDADNTVPGPGAYTFSPLHQHSVLRSTFNVTLGNPILENEVWQQQQQSAPHTRQTFVFGV